jgi:rubrerythrin
MGEVDLKKLLLDALDDERKAEATYAAVIERFGPVRPFSNIILAEQRHSRAIERQLSRLGFEVPPNQWTGKVGAPPHLVAACEMAVRAEIENIAFYDRLIPQIKDPAVRQVLKNLQRASRENHLPAFQRCLSRYADDGGGSCKSGASGLENRPRPGPSPRT